MKEEKKPIENELSLPKEMPKRDEKIVNITYPDGSNCDVIFTKMTEPIPKEKFAKVPREEAMNYCIEVPVNTTEYFVDDEKRVICLQDRPVKMRDGVTIYADIYIPASALKTPVPLIISWSFFGKQPWHQPVQIFRPMGVPTGAVSNSNQQTHFFGAIKAMQLLT